MGPEKSAWGNLYDEKGKARSLMRTPDEGWLKAKSIVHHGEWNSYEILAQGHHLTGSTGSRGRAVSKISKVV